MPRRWWTLVAVGLAMLVAAGVVISYVALRRLPALAPSPAPVAAEALAAGAEAGTAAGADRRATGPAAGPELAGRRS